MSHGLKNLQTAARSCSRRERLLDTSHPNANPHPDTQNYGAYSANHTDDSGYADELEAEYDADGASDRSSNCQSAGYHPGHHYSASGGSAGSGGPMMDGRVMGMYGGHGQGRLPSMDMGIDAIINRPGNGR